MVKNIAKYTWGDVVKVNNYSGDEYPINVAGCVCGITEISNDKLVEIYGQPLGSFVYTVEFGSGESFAIPELYLAVV